MPRFTVTILRKGQQLKKVFNQESFSVGRSLDCDVSLDDLGVSRVQVVVFRRGGQIWLEDKNSSNGTYLNQTRILPNTAVNIVPTDSIQLGKTSYILSIDLEVEMYEANDPDPIAETSAPKKIEFSLQPEEPEVRMESALIQKEILAMPFMATDETAEPVEVTPEPEVQLSPESLREELPVMEVAPMVVAAPLELVAEEPLAPVEVAAAPVVEPSFAEPGTETVVRTLVNDARKQSAQIIFEGEVQAEKRVQNIYRKAQEIQQQSEEQARETLNKAKQKAERLLAEHQQQGQELLHQARGLAQELREEVEVFVSGLKEKTRHETEVLLKQAQERAQEEGEKILERSRQESESKAAEIVSEAEREAHNLVHFAQMQSEEYKTSLVEAQRKSEDSLRECRRIEAELARLQQEQESKEAQKQTLLQDISKEEENISQVIKDLNDIRGEKSELEAQFRLLQQKEADVQRSLSAMEEKQQQWQKSAEGQKAEIEKNMLLHKEQAEKEATSYGQHLKLELNKRMQKMEEELFQSLVDKRASLTKEIFNAVEKQVVQAMEPAQWTAICQSTHQVIQDAVENKLVSFSRPVTMDEQPLDLKAKKRSEAVRWAVVGMCCGMLAFFLSGKFYNTLTQEQTMVQRQIASEAQARQEDLAKRQFNPIQSNDLKDSYTDAVIYTRGYSDKYLNAAFQEKFFKASAGYLLKTWRIEEDRTMQAVSISSALVKELTEKRQGLHPDFINDGITKMRALEQQNMARLKEVLGSEVRLESFRKFERRFYAENAP